MKPPTTDRVHANDESLEAASVKHTQRCFAEQNPAPTDEQKRRLGALLSD